MANLFQAAATKAAKEVKETKPKGTVIELPYEVDSAKVLTGESRKLHEAVTTLVEADGESKAAKNKANLAKGTIGKFAHPEVVRRLASSGLMPPGPIKFVNHEGESVTYVVTDKSKQYALKPDQVEDLKELLGEDGAAKLLKDETVFHFVPATMNEELTVSSEETDEDAPKTVADVVFAAVSEAIMGCDLLTDEQKGSLIESKQITRLVPEAAKLAPQVCGKDASVIEDLFDICKSQIVRYVKT
jgi:hypothetical protein